MAIEAGVHCICVRHNSHVELVDGSSDLRHVKKGTLCDSQQFAVQRVEVVGRAEIRTVLTHEDDSSARRRERQAAASAKRTVSSRTDTIVRVGMRDHTF